MSPSHRLFRRFLVGATLIGLVLLFDRWYFRVDVSRGRIHTLSSYSRSVIHRTQLPVRITWFRTSLLSDLSPAIRLMEDRLNSYPAVDPSRITVEIIDPVQAGLDADIRARGIIPRQLPFGEGDRQNLFDIWSGLLIEYGERSEIIPFIIEPEKIEYELTSRLLLLSVPESSKPRVYLLYGGKVPFMDLYPYVIPWLDYAGFLVDYLAFGEHPKHSGQPLVVIGTETISAETADAVEKYLDSGGKALIFSSGSIVATEGNWAARPKFGDYLLNLLEHRGLTVEPVLVLDNFNFRLSMPALDNSRIEFIDYPFWPTPPKTAIDIQQPIFSGYGGLQFFWPSSITFNETLLDSPVSVLVATGPAAAIHTEPFDTNPFGDLSVAIADAPRRGRFNLAVKTDSLILVSDELIISRMIDYTGTDYNLDFMVSGVEWLSGREELVVLKNRVLPDSSLHPDLDKMELHRLSLQLATIGTLVLPVLLLVAGIWFMILRRKKRV